MRKFCLWWLCAGFASTAWAVQISFDFGKLTPGQIPPGFISLASFGGKPANWSVAQEAVPPVLAPVLERAHKTVAMHSVLSPRSSVPGVDPFPMLLYTNEHFSDFTFTTRFKISGDGPAPMAGVVLRAQDPGNCYVVRASTDGYLLWYRVVGGKSYELSGIGVRIPVPKDVWQELRIECSGSQTRCFLDGKLAIPPAQAGAPTNNLAVNDTTFTSGEIGFWCKAGTKCAFVEASVRYTPKVAFAETVIAEMKKEYPRLLGLRIYANKEPGSPVIVGDLNGLELGAAGAEYNEEVIKHGVIYYLKDGNAVQVTLPLRDRNGDVAAALETRMKSFPGETQTTAVTRATVIKKAVEKRISALEDITR